MNKANKPRMSPSLARKNRDSTIDDYQFEKLCWNMFQKIMKRNPFQATLFGLHYPYDMMMEDGSPKGILDTLKVAKQWVNVMNRSIDYDNLTDEHKIDWKVVEFYCKLQEFSVLEHRLWEKNPDAFVMIGRVLFVMLKRNYASLDRRVEAIIIRLKMLPKYLVKFRTRFENSKPVKLWTCLAIQSCKNFRLLLQSLASETKEKVDHNLHNRLAKTVANLQQPLEEHQKWLRSLLPTADAEWAIGRKKFAKLLTLRGLSMSADEIYEIGSEYLAELKQEKLKLAEEISPGKNVEQVMALAEEANAPKTFEDALSFTKEIVERSRDFVVRREIATVYPEDALAVEETPAFMAPLTPYAELIPPGKFDKRQEGIYVVTRPQDSKNLGSNQSYASIPGDAVHEGFPGHFLQNAISNRGSFVRLLSSPSETSEGWAHYCEQMMREKGFIKELEIEIMPPQRARATAIMHVNEEIWRAVCVMLDVKLSCGEMDLDDAVHVLMKDAEMSEEAAVAEACWYTQSPGDPLSYLIGKHMILQLRDDLRKKMGENFKEKVFHETIIANGRLPIFLLRQSFELKGSGTPSQRRKRVRRIAH